MSRETLVFAFDLGTASVGWSVLKTSGDDDTPELLDLGARIFSEVVELKSGELKNAARRSARGLRKNIRQRRWRRDRLVALLKKHGLAPDVAHPFGRTEPHQEVYALRARAAHEEVSLHELGRIFHRFAKRRGFKSNRGAKLAKLKSDPEIAELLARDDRDNPEAADKEESKFLKDIAETRDALDGATLGEFLSEKVKSGARARGTRFDRAMIEAEFDRIYETQRRFHPGVLTDALKADLHEVIFTQRPLRVQRFLVKTCDLEAGRKRAAKGALIAQEYRIWQAVHNLEVLPETGTPYRPTWAQKQALAAALLTKSELTWKQVRNLVGAGSKDRLNLEATGDKRLRGNTTDARLRNRLPDLWPQWDSRERERLVEILLTSRDAGTAYKALRKTYGFAPELAYRLALTDLDAGVASLSSAAMRKLVYGHVDPDTGEKFLGMSQGATLAEAKSAIYPEAHPARPDQTPKLEWNEVEMRRQITNPRVRKTLGQLRKVVNALIEVHGRPNAIRIEMARDLQLSPKEKEKVNKTNEENRKANDRARERLQALGIPQPSRQEIIWWKLGEECGWTCPYCGGGINVNDVKSMSDFEIEHIIPYSVSLDDSFVNLTLSHRECNAKKGNRLPRVAFPDRFDAMMQRVEKFKGPGLKKKLFAMTEEELNARIEKGEFLDRQLNETRYITREAATLLKSVADEVTVTKGQAVALMRRLYGLNHLLFEDGEKERTDHRHHAVDALAVGLTTRSVYQKLQRWARDSKDGRSPLTEKPRLPGMPDDLVPKAKSLLERTIVSHEVSRKVRGALHEETVYGQRADGTFHVRKPLTGLTRGQAEAIVDADLRSRVLAALDAKAPLEDGIETQSGTVARRARVRVKGTLRPIPRGWIIPGSNHHVEVFEDETGKRSARFVTMIDAAARGARREPLVDTTPMAGFPTFLFAVYWGDIIRMPDGRLVRVVSLESSDMRLGIRNISDARPAKDITPERAPLRSCHFTPVQIDILGRDSSIGGKLAEGDG